MSCYCGDNTRILGKVHYKISINTILMGIGKRIIIKMKIRTGITLSDIEF